jgi:signal transduction histidine kinase
MTIRARLIWWYSAILLLAMLSIVAAVYYEIFVEHPVLRQRMEGYRESPAEELSEALVFAVIPVTLIAFIVGGFLIRRALAPLTRFAQAVERIHVDNLRTQLPRSGEPDELDRLAEVFNAMTARLDESFQRVREFTLHASHELKTPLAIMHAELETALREEALSEPERQRASSLLEELQRLTQIVDGLNFLTRADAGLIEFEQAPVRFDELVVEACADARVLAEQRHVAVRADDCPPLTVLGDRRRLRQLLLILTDNATKYNYPGGEVRIVLRSGENEALLRITNTGPGIPPELIHRVFDRFFRGDASHNKEIDGCGLGLSIARRIVEAHAGKIYIESEVNQQTTVTIRLPARRETMEIPETTPMTRAA